MEPGWNSRCGTVFGPYYLSLNGVNIDGCKVLLWIVGTCKKTDKQQRIEAWEVGISRDWTQVSERVIVSISFLADLASKLALVCSYDSQASLTT